MIKYKILFICDGATDRSPTFSDWMNKYHPEFESKYLGIYTGETIETIKTQLQSSDIIFVMTLKQKMFIHEYHPEFFKKTHIIGVEDIYYKNDPDLLHQIEFWYNELFPFY